MKTARLVVCVLAALGAWSQWDPADARERRTRGNSEARVEQAMERCRRAQGQSMLEERAEGHARGWHGRRRRKDRSYRAGNLQSAERVVAGLLQRDPAGTARHAISRRAYQFLVTSTGSAIGASATTATGGGGTALRWSSSSRMNAAPAAVSLNSQRLFFTPSKMRE